MIPVELRRFFWDTDPNKISALNHKFYIIERILEYGDEKAVRWIFSEYPRAEINSVLEASRSLSPKSRNFWRLRFKHSNHA
jgi:hypothetical protein